jgi:hypothetical protein
MKKFITLSFFMGFFLHLSAQEPSLTVEFTTVDMGGFSHEKHVLAVWVETETEQFVKTQLVYADVRKACLYTWNGPPANGNEVDAITGATQEHHKTYTVTWDCKDLSENIIQNGNYVLHIEMNNKYIQGPLAEIGFSINSESFTLNPDDEDYFKNISLVYDNGNSSSINNNLQNNKILTVYPNPAKDVVNFLLNLKNDEYLTIQIYDNKFQLIKEITDNRLFTAGKNTFNWNIDKKTADGTYFILISSKTHVWFGQKILILK